MLLDDHERYAIHFGDCITHMGDMAESSVDFAAYSPPFPSVYSYSSKAEDIGNSENLAGEAPLHFGFFFAQMLKVLKPGRIMVLHCTQIVRMKRSGHEGNYDFRGLLIRLAQRAGFIYDYDWLVRVGPQQQAIITKSRQLQFSGLEADRAQSRGANGDYLIKFRKPGENAVPINSKQQVSRNDWIEWAECCWDNINRTETLNIVGSKGPEDTRHICPLQLDVIKRLVKLYSNPGEIVFSPFAGIGSELYCAIMLGRRGYGCELKPEYYAKAIENCESAIKQEKEDNRDLWELSNVSTESDASLEVAE